MSKVRVVSPRLRVLLASSVVPGDRWDASRAYKAVLNAAVSDASTGSATISYRSGSGVRGERGSFGLASLETQDSLSSQSASLMIGLGSLGDELTARMRPMDRVRIEILGGDGAPWWTLFDGFLASPVASDSSTTGHFSRSVNLQCEGVQRLLVSSVFNWQKVVQPESDILGEKGGAKSLHDVLAKDACSPQELIAALVRCALRDAMSLEIGTEGEANIAFSDFFLLGSQVKGGGLWSNVYGSTYPLPRHLLSNQAVSFWQLFQQLAEPDLHELFLSYVSQDGKAPARPTLVFRPRPFPGEPGGRGDALWKALPVAVVGKGSAPAPDAVSSAMDDGGRASAYHFASMGFTDHQLTPFDSGRDFGFILDRRLLARYGYVARPMALQMALLSSPGASEDKAKAQGIVDTIKGLMWSWAHQEACVAESGRRTLQFRSLSLGAAPWGVRPGYVLEDWTRLWPSPVDGRPGPETGYVTSVGFSVRSGLDGIESGWTVGTVRSVRGADRKAYPDAIRARVKLERVSYLGDGVGRGSYARSGAATGKLAPFVPKPPRTVPVEEAVTSALARHAIPRWVLCHVLALESGFGRNPAAYRPQASGALGIAQLRPVAVADLNQIGYKKPSGAPFSDGDRLSDADSIDAAAAYLKRCRDLVRGSGCPASPDMSLWCWVLYAYRHGAGAAAVAGSASSWIAPAASLGPEWGRYWGLPVATKARAAYGG